MGERFAGQGLQESKIRSWSRTDVLESQTESFAYGTQSCDKPREMLVFLRLYWDITRAKSQTLQLRNHNWPFQHLGQKLLG